jgi:long-chain acyl-CoA synthetase
VDTLLDLLDDAVRRFPTTTAVTMRVGVRSTHYTYLELRDRASQFAALLAERGVAAGDRVVFWSPNHPDYVAALFGTFMAGAIAVPLDVNCSRDFTERVVGQTTPRLAFATQRLAAVLDELGVPAIAFETLTLPASRSSEIAALDRDAVAEIVFTSGTTGDPKGVMLSHGNITANVKAILGAVPLPSNARMLSILPLSHMFEQVGGCFCPMAVGASVRYLPTRQPSAVVKTMREWRPTAIAGVPQLLSAVMAGIEREATAQGRLPMLQRLRAVASRLPKPARRLLFRSVLARLGGALDFVITGGAAVDPELQRKWEAMGVDVLEGYGATECGPVITSNPLGGGRVGSVGRVLPGQEIRIAPDGEVLTRGANVFVGYWQNAAATAAAFDGAWYRTGDLGEIDADGYLRLKGRKKDLIVLADGQNVYPEDVESALKRQPGIADAVVIGIAAQGNVRLHAALVPSSPGAAPEVLRDAVRNANAILDGRQQVLDYTVWPEPAFPLTHTLKVRRPLVQAYLLENTAPPPVTPALPADADPLLRVIASVARGEALPREDDTLGDDLGLDSLSRVELLSVIEEELGAFIDDTAVGPNTTVRELRALAEGHSGPAPAIAFPAWSRRPPATQIRAFALPRLIGPGLRFFYRVGVEGLEHALAVRGPCLVISNHSLHWDVGLLVTSMPTELRERLAIAAAADDIFGNRARGFGAALFGNAFPFSKDGSGVRASLEYLASTLDAGWSVLIFPEGMLTVHGPMQPFKSGSGLLAVDAGVPVLPMRLDVLREGSADRWRWWPPRRGLLRLSFGEPLRLPPGTPYDRATAELERAVREA